MKRNGIAFALAHVPQTLRCVVSSACLLFFLFSLGYGADYTGNYQGSLRSYSGDSIGISISMSQAGLVLAGTVTLTDGTEFVTLPFSGTAGSPVNPPYFTASGQTSEGSLQLTCHTLGLQGDTMFGFYNISLNGGLVDMGQFSAIRPTIYYSLSVTKSGYGSGTVTSLPSGINCGATCTASFSSLTTVALTATADAGSVFASWTGCDSVTGNVCTVATNAPRSVTAAFGSLLYADFGSAGISMWNGSIWSQLTPSNPENLLAAGRFLYADFGSDGTWMWNGAWRKLSFSNPDNMVASGSYLYADFGSDGTWMWDGAWRKLSFSNPDNMVASGSYLYADFGSDGTWMWDGAWRKLSFSNPDNMVASGSYLYADFGSGGIWMSWNGGPWSQLTTSNPDNMVASGSYLYADLGSDGTWMWNGSNWSKLTTSNPENMLASGALLYVDFGSDGTWMWDGSNWSKLTTSNPENMVASGSYLYADFGSAGTWMWDGSNWSKLTSSNLENMVVP